MKKEVPILKKAQSGRPGIDWPELYNRWLSQTTYPDIPSFLSSYGVDAEQRRVKFAVKGWETGENKPPPIEPVYKPAVQEIIHLADEQPHKYESNIKRVWTMIRSWRAVQAENDYRVGNKLRRLIEGQIDTLKEKMDNNEEVKTFDITALAKAMETVQRVQRLSLGMSTENVGVEDAQKLAEEQAADGQAESDAPVFAVEVNQNGKFTRLRPRRVQ